MRAASARPVHEQVPRRRRHDKGRQGRHHSCPIEPGAAGDDTSVAAARHEHHRQGARNVNPKCVNPKCANPECAKRGVEFHHNGISARCYGIGTSGIGIITSGIVGSTNNSNAKARSTRANDGRGPGRHLNDAKHGIALGVVEHAGIWPDRLHRNRKQARRCSQGGSPRKTSSACRDDSNNRSDSGTASCPRPGHPVCAPAIGSFPNARRRGQAGADGSPVIGHQSCHRRQHCKQGQG